MRSEITYRILLTKKESGKLRCLDRMPDLVKTISSRKQVTGVHVADFGLEVTIRAPELESFILIEWVKEIITEALI